MRRPNATRCLAIAFLSTVTAACAGQDGRAARSLFSQASAPAAAPTHQPDDERFVMESILAGISDGITAAEKAELGQGPNDLDALLAGFGMNAARVQSFAAGWYCVKGKNTAFNAPDVLKKAVAECRAKVEAKRRDLASGPV